MDRLERLKSIASRTQIKKELSTSPKSKMWTVVFHLINPDRQLISIRDVVMQQDYCGGKLAREEALEHQLNLMAEREHKASDWNVEILRWLFLDENCNIYMPNFNILFNRLLYSFILNNIKAYLVLHTATFTFSELSSKCCWPRSFNLYIAFHPSLQIICLQI